MHTGMVRPDDDFGRDYGLIHEAVVSGRKAGAGREFWAKLAHDRTLFGKVVTFVRGAHFVGTTQNRAFEIMGPNFFGVADAIQHFQVIPSPHKLDDLSRVPFSEQTLEECRDTHVLLAVFPLSINQIRNRVAGDHDTLFCGSDWYHDQPFATERGKTEWQLVRKTPVPSSTGPMAWEERLALLAKNEEVPRARVVVYMMVGYYLVTGDLLLRNLRVYCADRKMPDNHVDIGGVDPARIENDYRGLASARKAE
jgi:hypothetical protein